MLPTSADLIEALADNLTMVVLPNSTVRYRTELC